MPNKKLTSEVVGLLQPLISAEQGARYFYEAARTWAKRTEYCGALNQFKCFVHYHKHNIKMLMNLFAEWEMMPEFATIPSPAFGDGSLPEILAQALTVENGLIDPYNSAALFIMNADLNVHTHFEKIRAKAQKWWEEMREYNEKLELFDITDKLSLVYYDRKILRW